MCLFDTSNYFAAAGAWARSCFMHLMPWMAPGNARHYLHAVLKAKDLVAPAGPRAVFAVTIQMCFGGHGDSRVLNASVLWALTRGDKFWSHAQLTLVNCTCTELPSREKSFNLEHNWFFKAVSVCWGWSYYSFYQNFEDLVLFTHLIKKWLSALERDLLN